MPGLLLDARQRALMEEVRSFVATVPHELLQQMDADEVQYPGEFLKSAAESGLLGLRFAPEYGGRGLSWEDEVIALEEIGVLGSSLACLYSLVSIVGESIHAFGSDDQKTKYLSSLVGAKLFPAEGLTEPRGGSDFFGATARATPVPGGYQLEGQKRFVVGAEGADLFMIYARTAEDKPHKSISAFLVERQEAIRVEYLYGLLGTRGGGAGRIVFDGAFVPEENVVLGLNRGAEVFNQMMIPERLTTAAGALGLARAALDIAARYSDKRYAFGQKIRVNQAVSFKISDGITRLDAARSLVRNAARAVDIYGSTGTTRRLVSEAKKFSSQAAWDTVNGAMQVLGGIGYTNVYPVEKLLRDARIMMIWTGTNEIMDLIIQHEYYREILGSEPAGRDIEMDAVEAGASDEKIFQ
jgi:acyl-CoA dehydrogenase